MQVPVHQSDSIARCAIKPYQLRLDGLRRVRFPRSRVRDLIDTSLQLRRLGEQAGANLCANAAALLVVRYVERRDGGQA